MQFVIRLTDSIRGRLRMVTGTVGTLLVLSGVVGWWSAHRLGAATRETLASVRLAAELSTEFAATIAQEIQAAHHYVDARGPFDLAEFQRLSFAAHGISSRMNRAVGQSADETALIARIDQQLALAETFYARAHRLIDLGRGNEGRREGERATPVIQGVLTDLQQLGRLTAQKVATVSGRLEQETQRQRWQLGAFLVGFLLIAVVVSRIVGASISMPLAPLVAHAQRLSQGDLSARTPPAPLPREFRVLADAMNRAAASLSELAEKEALLRQGEKHTAVGQLVSGVAHELNNPLGAVLLQVENILDEHPDHPQAKELEEIRSHATRARRTVRDLLSFVRDRHAAHEPVAPASLIEHALRGIEAQLRRMDVRVDLAIPPGLPRLLVDRIGTEQVVTNLVLNAGQAAGAGGTVRVIARRTEEGCEIVVEDSGPGIRPEILPRIFEPFFTTRGEGEGTGLGLSAALGIVEQHGGTLRAENGERGSGVGARFIVNLPRAYDTAEWPVPEPGADVPPTPNLAAPAEPAAARPRVLIVDAEATARATLRRYFTRRQWRVDEARGGDEALMLITPGIAPDFALILADLQTAGAPGIALHDRLRAEQPALLERLVILTGDAAPPGAREFLARTHCSVLRKPVDQLELDALVRKMAPTHA
ncbi:MAG: response regulator [Gemmatimonadetes bacterium]|nr:response regulator [Gemmatimonadota bacterium]